MGEAVISDCGTYRYTLRRTMPQIVRWVHPCLFIMLNPSTATADTDDATIRRCLGFANAWGCTSLTVVNLFALRARDPRELSRHAAPVGPMNDAHITAQIDLHRHSGVIVAAWGAHKLAPARARQIAPQLELAQVLDTTISGWPRHPLYLPAGLEPRRWSMPAAA